MNSNLVQDNEKIINTGAKQAKKGVKLAKRS